MPGVKWRGLIENLSNIIKCWFKCTFSNKLPWHFKKNGGILNYLGQESIKKRKKEVSFFSRLIVGNSANDVSSFKIVYRVTGVSGCKLNVCYFKIDTLRLLQQTLNVAIMVVVF